MSEENVRTSIIDRPIIDLLKITSETQLEVTTDGERLIITPLSSKGIRAQAVRMESEMTALEVCASQAAGVA